MWTGFPWSPARGRLVGFLTRGDIVRKLIGPEKRPVNRDVYREPYRVVNAVRFTRSRFTVHDPHRGAPPRALTKENEMAGKYTLTIIKPDAFGAHKTGKIIALLEEKGFIGEGVARPAS